jgi:hypothetical protein
MYRRLFSTHYISHFEESPLADWLKDFDDWLQARDYCLPKRRQHIAHVRYVLERTPALPDDRRFDATDLDRMFNCRVRPRSFRHAHWAIEQYLRSRDLWIVIPAVGPHQQLIDAYATYLRDMQGLASATIDQKLRVVRGFLTLCCPPPRKTQQLTARDVERFVARRARQLGRSAII